MRENRSLGALAAIAVAAVSIASAAPAAAATCESLATLALPSATVTAAEVVPAGGLPQTGGRGTVQAAPAADLPAFCRVAATLKPTADSDIKMEVWLPAAGWNGKFLAVGNGGWNGTIDRNALAAGLRRGYATAGTDTGHEGGGGPWMQNPEKLVDFGYRAVHETTVKAKAIVNAFYGNAPRFAFFQGCSAGGRQGMKAAQRFPEDFDGIVAGAPAINTTGRAAYAMYVAQNLRKEEGGYIPASKYPAIHGALLKACDALDGVTDGVVENPRVCKFDPGVLACSGAETDACLTAPQVTAARKMYTPVVHARTNKVIFQALEPGTELGWATFGNTQPFPIGAQMYQFMVFKDPAWDFRTLDFGAHMDLVDGIEKGNINALDPNLKAFAARGGKLIHYHGWADQQIPAGSSVDYHQSVVAAMGPSVRNNYRMFMVPGMGHCGGGAGTTTFDMLTALEQWVEQGKAPDAIPASRVSNGRTDRTRPLCPYPQVATYKGSGSTDEAASFVCK